MSNLHFQIARHSSELPRMIRVTVKIIFGSVVAISLLAASVAPRPLMAGELYQPLREASELYRLGRLDAARELALSVQKAFPRDLQALLLLCCIDTAARRYSEAKTWIGLASAISPRHPIVASYRHLFDELEYRSGPLSTEYLPLPGPDQTVTAKRFKKGWFGPNFLYLEPKIQEATRSAGLRKESKPRPALNEDIMIEEMTVRDAEEALSHRMFLKAYLLFSRLIKDNPESQAFEIGKARACIGLARYREAVSILDPYVAAEKELDSGFTRAEIDELYRQAKAGPDGRIPQKKPCGKMLIP